MKTSISKKEIRQNLEAALIFEIEKMEGSESSRKVKKAVRRMSKNIAGKVKVDIKKQHRKAAKRNKTVSKKERNNYLLENVAENVENGRS